MSTVQEILYAATLLPTTERAEIIHALWGTIEPQDWPAPSEEWIAEANRRADAIDQGTISTRTWSEARKAARREAGLDG